MSVVGPHVMAVKCGPLLGTIEGMSASLEGLLDVCCGHSLDTAGHSL